MESLPNIDLSEPLLSFTSVKVLDQCLYFLNPYQIWTSMTPVCFFLEIWLVFIESLPNMDLSEPLPSFTSVKVLDRCLYFLNPYPIWTSMTPVCFSQKFCLCLLNPFPIWTSLNLSLPLLLSMFLTDVYTL